MVKTGTKEWATENKNIYHGCRRRCRYCYRHYNDVRRFHRRKSDRWKEMRFNRRAFNERPYRLRDGRIFMFSGHDIFKQNIDRVIEYLKKWLEVGNELLIVTKPIYECVKKLCDELEGYKDKITFRFTIGSRDNDTLRFWDGGEESPLFGERKKSLMLAFKRGFKTSVSCEPYFDYGIEALVKELYPYITDSIWIGKMNEIKSRVNTKGWKPEDYAYLERLKQAQTDDKIWELYRHLKKYKKVRWKESCKKVLGLSEERIG